MISLYYFWKHVETATHPLVRRLHAGGLSIDDFARDPSARNRISGVFLKGTLPEAFAFLGIQEHFQADCEDLYRMMGWPEAETLRVNQSPEPGYDDQRKALYEDDRLIERLVALNEGDMALYEKGLQLRARRLEQARILPIREQVGPDRLVDCA